MSHFIVGLRHCSNTVLMVCMRRWFYVNVHNCRETHVPVPVASAGKVIWLGRYIDFHLRLFSRRENDQHQPIRRQTLKWRMISACRMTSDKHKKKDDRKLWGLLCIWCVFGHPNAFRCFLVARQTAHIVSRDMHKRCWNGNNMCVTTGYRLLACIQAFPIRWQTMADVFKCTQLMRGMHILWGNIPSKHFNYSLGGFLIWRLGALKSPIDL